MYQFYNLLPVLNVDENIVLPHLLDGRKMEQERLDMMVEYLGLTDRRKNLPSQLSGGQQQRVSIGRALFNHPAIILADEPTGNLDRKNGEEIMRLLKDSNRKQKQTLILITHNGNETDWAQKLQALSEQDNAEFYISKAGENAMMVSVAEAVAYIIKILAVCFVILTSVICILNLYNSIWGRVVSRKQEFGTLKSLGMTRKQMVKMLFYENVGLFLKGTLWSGVISIPVIYLLRPRRQLLR